MKKQILVVISLTVFVCGPSSLLGMDFTPSAQPAESHSRALFSARSESIVDAIHATRKGGDIRFESPFFSDRDIVDALSDAAQRGVAVSVHVGSRSRANRQKMLKAGVAVKEIDGLHAKRCILSQPRTRKRRRGDDQENIAANAPHLETRVFVGSDNLSYLSRSHAEMMVETQGDSAYHAESRELFRTPDDRARTRSVIGVTPQRRTAVGSRDHFMNQSKAMRIIKLAESSARGDSVDLTSMTFDNEDIVSAIEEVYKKRRHDRPTFRLILDRSALRHKDLLDRIKVAGGADVSIHIYNEDAARKIFQRFPQIQHTKTITRACGDDRLVVVSTGNLTDHSDSDFNVDSYHPGDTQLFDDIRAYNDALAAECTEYTG